jgi:tetratricopeptide (TPR) repeat protein
MNMKSFLKKLPIIILIGIGIGVPLGLVSSFATEEQLEVITPVLVLMMAAVLILIFTSAILKANKFNKEVTRLLKILYEDINAEKYIKETKDAISKTKNKSFKLHFALNLAIGYDALGEYQEAIDHMRALNISDARWIYKALYYNNLAFFYYEAGNCEAAIQAYSHGEKFINKLLEKPIYSGGPLHTKGIIEYSKGNFAFSEELLEKSKLQLNTNNHLVTSANLYIAKICLQTNRMPKARLLLDYNLSQKLLPNILAETKKVIEEMNSTNTSMD